MISIGFFGSGKMASALVSGIIRAHIFSPDQIGVTDILPAAAAELARASGAREYHTNSTLASEAATLVLAVKPVDAVPLLQSLPRPADSRLLISIAAGLPLATLEAAVPEGYRVVRAMPNTPALVLEGAAAVAAGKTATPDDLTLALQIFRATGQAFAVKEALLDAVTGLSGSGPAYIFTVIEALADGGVLMGLPRDVAMTLAAQTALGAAKMVLETATHPAVLRDQVASPGGTTIAGIEALEQNGVRAGMIAAVRAATERSKTLGS
jgi:pyrroline-5-carboxylate reductase